METVRIGIVGSGEMGRFYAESVVKYNEGVQLAGITGGTRAPKLAADYGVESVPDLEAMLKRDDIDALVIATPHQVHAEQVIAAAEHEKHVLLEKPMAPSVPDCDAMIDACNKANVTLAIIKSLRYWGVMARAKELIDQGRVGEIRMVQVTSLYGGADPTKLWSVEPEAGGGLLDLGCHIFDMLRWLTRDEAVRVFGRINSYDVEDYQTMNAMVQVEFSRGALAQVWMGHEVPEPIFPHSGYLFRIWGEHGLIDADARGKLMLSADGQWEEVWEEPPRNGNDFEPWRMERHHRQTQNFVDSLRFGRPPPVSGEDGRAAIEMVQATHMSNLGGMAVNLPLPRIKGGMQFDGASVSRDRIPG